MKSAFHKTFKVFIYCIAFIYIPQSQAQVFKNTDKGIQISFFSETPVENISANSSSAGSVLNFNNDSLLFKIPIKTFHFQNALMEEHFNENYMESNKYPYAFFKGKFDKHIDPTKPGEYNVSVNGVLTIHGVSRPRTIQGKLKITQNQLPELSSEFKVKLVDHSIEVPQLVWEKIAEEIQVKVNGKYQKVK